MMAKDYVQVTEISGDDVSREQIARMYSRYAFARRYCSGKDVLEAGCGSGQGLGYLAKTARTVIGGDYSGPLLQMARSHYRGRVPLVRLDAQSLPFGDRVFDVVILYEAVYYLAHPEAFVEESERVLRPGGVLVICNANKDLPDFNPSPYSYRYFSAPDFVRLLESRGFRVECFGDCRVDYDHPKQRFFSCVKKMMVRLNLMPKTMAGKKILKRIIFGRLVPLPPELGEEGHACELPDRIESSVIDRCHKVIFGVARKPDGQV